MPRETSQQTINLIQEVYLETGSINKAAKAGGVSSATVYKYCAPIINDTLEPIQEESRSRTNSKRKFLSEKEILKAHRKYYGNSITAAERLKESEAYILSVWEEHNFPISNSTYTPYFWGSNINPERKRLLLLLKYGSSYLNGTRKKEKPMEELERLWREDKKQSQGLENVEED